MLKIEKCMRNSQKYAIHSLHNEDKNKYSSCLSYFVLVSLVAYVDLLWLRDNHEQ